MFYSNLGGTAGVSIASSHNANCDLFTNVQSYAYWSGLEYAPIPSLAWFFPFDSGDQGASIQSKAFFAWAVRPGDVAATVPAPGTVVLMGLGLAGLMGACGRRRHSMIR